ncbi:MAG: cytochrome P450 [Solirubrobacteraceae bacterium]|jgi:cytochrome P450
MQAQSAQTTIPTGLPPGPRMSRALQSVIWYRRAQWLMDQCQARFGDMFTLKIANEGTWVITSDPDTIKQVFTGDPRLLHAGEANRILLPVLGPDSVLLLDDAPHLRQRKLMLGAFHGERMQRYGALMADVAAREIERWPLNQPYPLRPRMQAMTLEIVLRAVFGVSDGPRMDELRRELRRLLDTVTDPLKGIAMLTLGPDRITRVPAFRRELERINAPIYAEIADRRTATDLAERDDIMSLLLQATHEDGSPMSDSELRDELLTLLVAGHETTANALSWAVERLCRHPERMERLTEEARAGDDDTYLKAVVQETLRLRPVISIVLRTLQEPMELGGRLLPAGVSIVPSIHLVHRRADIYPEPNEFRPERFIESEGGKDWMPARPYTWIPFGGGIRRCLGAAFAQFEMEVVLRELVLRRTLAPARPESERNYRRAITETPRYDATVIVGRCPVAVPAAAPETMPETAPEAAPETEAVAA